MRKPTFAILAALTVLTMVLAACGPAATTAAPTQPPAPTQPQATQPPAPTSPPAATATQAAPAATEPPAATTEPSPTPTTTPYPIAQVEAGKVPIYWYVGLGTGTDPAQLPVEQSVVDDFNKSQTKIQLILVIIPYNSAKTTLQVQIASGNPQADIVGPVGWSGSMTFYGQWLDIAPLIKAANYDTSQFNPANVKMFQTEEGQVGLPFAVYPSAIMYSAALFDAAGLEYPPAKYGDKYKMPDGTMADWSWDTLTQVAKLLTLDANGKNSTETGFDATKIVQYGFSWIYENQPVYYGSFWAGGSLVAPGGSKGSYKAQVPDSWKAAWKWTYDAIWGAQPFMPNDASEQSADFGNGNPFGVSKVAMTDTPLWFTCCVGDNKSWDFAAMPTYNGKVGGRIDADTFRILKTTKHPQEAFTVMQYLVGPAVQKLIIGDANNPPAYGALPARAKDQTAYIDSLKTRFPWVKNIDVMLAGLNYPDIPSAEGFMPNYAEAWDRQNTFGSLMRTTKGLDLTAEETKLINDLTTIFNK